MLICFVPFRKETDLLNGFLTYHAALEHAIENHLIQVEDYNIFSDKRKKMIQAIAKIKEIESITNPTIDLGEINNNLLDLGAAEYINDYVDQGLLYDKIDRLNADQKAVFDYVTHMLDNQDNNLINANNARIFCTGVAGKFFSIIYKTA